MSTSVGLGCPRLLLDGTVAHAVLDGDLDVALLTPVSAPGVLDHPVILTGSAIVTPTSDEHFVISVSTAAFAVNDAAAVLVPGV